MARPTSHWFNPSTKVYRYNYGFGINYYQPMIDYIDNKDKGRYSRYPHLPWTDERGLHQYNPKGLVRSYSDQDLTTISRRTEARAKTHLKDFKATTKSQFQLEQSVSAATITRKVHTEEKKSKKRELLHNIKVLKSKITDKNEYDPEMDQRIENSLKTIKKHIRGKSAKAIESQLLAESRKHIAEECDLDAMELLHSKASSKMRMHAKLMDIRMQDRLDESITKPLGELSEELKGFNKRSTYYFMDKR